MADDPELLALRTEAAEHLDWQAARARRYLAYYDGNHDILALLNTEERQAFRQFLRESGANWCELVVNAVAERLSVVGFRFTDPADSDAAWQIWQASRMDADSELSQTDALVTGSAPVLVQRDDDSPTGVSITPESPLEATVIHEPGNRRQARAGYKRYAFKPGGASVVQVLMTPEVIATWWPGQAEAEIAPNPAGEVTMIEIVPQPTTYGWPRSELRPALPIQDRVNTTIFNRMVATDYGAFRQIWATGIRLARRVIREDDGTERTTLERPFDIGANRLLTSEDPAARFGSFPESTLAGYLASVEQDVNQLAAITQTPPHYLLGQIVNISADAIKAAEAGLVAKVRRRSRHIGEAWEQAIRIALALTGRPGATDVAAEVVWADMETRSEAQRADALVKMGTLGVPREVLWERWGATPQEIARWRSLAASEQAAAVSAIGAPEGAYAQLLAAAGPPPGQQQPPQPMP